MTAYYNEIDPFAAAWLRELIEANEIAPGIVDTRSIEDVTPNDLAGIGIWSAALRGAGWPDDRRVWTGSCPCQPFSAAGKGDGFADERHLWPAWFHLITQCGPDVVFGEQVASKDGLAWLDLVQADMEAADFAFGAVDLCAAGFGAPHIRQRTFFAGLGNPASGRRGKLGNAAWPGRSGHADGASDAFSGMANPTTGGRPGPGRSSGAQEQRASELRRNGGLADASHSTGQRSEPRSAIEGLPPPVERDVSERPAGPTNGSWRAADWLFCRDGKWRPVRPGSFPLVNGAPARVGRLRGYGNGIVRDVAQGFIETVKEIIG